MAIKSTNRYSCVLDSFAFIIGVAPSVLIDRVGHLGFERKGEGQGIRPLGYHVQELIGPLADLGYSVTPFELYPVTYDEGSKENRLVWFGNQHNNCNEVRLQRYMTGKNGVLTGRNRQGTGHAVAWMDGKVHDPAGANVYDLFYRDILSPGPELWFDPLAPFLPVCFWRVTKDECNSLDEVSEA